MPAPTSNSSEMEEKLHIIPHCSGNGGKYAVKWEATSRCDQQQYMALDPSKGVFALFSSPCSIELWDLSSSPVALAALDIPIRTLLDVPVSATLDSPVNHDAQRTQHTQHTQNTQHAQHRQQYEDTECQSIAWSDCKRYLFAVFGTLSRLKIDKHDKHDRQSLSEASHTVCFLWDVAIGCIISSFRLPFSVTSASFLPHTANAILLGESDISNMRYVAL